MNSNKEKLLFTVNSISILINFLYNKFVTVHTKCSKLYL